MFIYRDLLAVASSFEVRARDLADTDWPPENDHQMAYKQWSDSFAAAERLLEVVGPERLLPLKYERLFDGPAAYEALFSFLGLEPWDGTRQAFADLGAGLGRKVVGSESGSTERRLAATALTADQQAMVGALDQSAVERWDARFESAVRVRPGPSGD